VQTARIAELLQPFLSNMPDPCHSESGRRPGEACSARSRRDPAVRSHDQLRNISTYIDLLLRWNARINLTAIRDPEEIVTRHFGESFFAARHLFPTVPNQEEHEFTARGKTPNFSHVRGREALQGRASRTNSIGASAPEAEAQAQADDRRPKTENKLHVADLGSGAGFPGIPIKLWAPNIALTLIESNHKKTAFLREVTRALTLTNVYIQNVRAESLPPGIFDLVTLRAVERFTAVLPIAARLVTPAGRLALLIASSQIDTTMSILPTFHWNHPILIPESTSGVFLLGTNINNSGKYGK
jgi:16S rRNA (guanine527-N7)-methyltransferase